MEEREQFVRSAMRKEIPFAWLCDQFGISRRVGYKWLERFENGGLGNLGDRRREAHHKSHATSQEVVERLLAAKKAWPHWGPKKLIAWLRREAPDKPVLGHSAAYAILNRHQLVQPDKRRRRWSGQERAPAAERPNALWFADHKGHFVAGNKRCEPLTVSDAYSRKLLLAAPVATTSIDETKRYLTRTCQEYGLPDGMQTDNGGSFGSTGLGRLSRLSVWLLHLDVAVYRSRPAKRTDNGQHERIHATLLKEVMVRIRSGMPAADALEEWRNEYNSLRPDEALQMGVPDENWTQSERQMPQKLSEITYPEWLKTRRVRGDGSVKLRGEHVFLSEVLTGELVGLEPLEHGGHLLHVGPLVVATIGHDHRVIAPRDPQRYGVRASYQGGS